jgi:hypothetical protein
MLTANFTLDGEMCEVFTFTTDDEIKILTLLKRSDGISWKVIDVEGLPYYGVVAKVRDFQKQGFTTNVEGILGITEKGEKHLNQLLYSKGKLAGSSVPLGPKQM